MVGPERHHGKVLEERLRLMQRGLGGLLSPLDCYLTQRGIRTLAPRIERAQENARKVAKFLETRDEVEMMCVRARRAD